MSKRILIAEDELVSRESLSDYARSKGYEVVAVSDGTDILKNVFVEQIDLIITDLMMPHLNGASAAEIMKLQGSKLPVIALTALTPQDIKIVEDIFVKVFYKPCNYLELFQYIETLIGK